MYMLERRAVFGLKELICTTAGSTAFCFVDVPSVLAGSHASRKAEFIDELLCSSVADYRCYISDRLFAAEQLLCVVDAQFGNLFVVCHAVVFLHEATEMAAGYVKLRDYTVD